MDKEHDEPTAELERAIKALRSEIAKLRTDVEAQIRALPRGSGAKSLEIETSDAGPELQQQVAKLEQQIRALQRRVLALPMDYEAEIKERVKNEIAEREKVAGSTSRLPDAIMADQQGEINPAGSLPNNRAHASERRVADAPQIERPESRRAPAPYSSDEQTPRTIASAPAQQVPTGSDWIGLVAGWWSRAASASPVQPEVISGGPRAFDPTSYVESLLQTRDALQRVIREDNFDLECGIYHLYMDDPAPTLHSMSASTTGPSSQMYCDACGKLSAVQWVGLLLVVRSSGSAESAIVVPPATLSMNKFRRGYNFLLSKPVADSFESSVTVDTLELPAIANMVPAGVGGKRFPLTKGLAQTMRFTGH